MKSISVYTFKLKYIFFLVFLVINICSNKNYSQSNKSNSTISNKDSLSVGEILFISNLNGVIENCKCGKPPLGGLPQISSLVNENIIKNKYSYFLDGGDFLNTYPYPLLNTAVIDIYKVLNIKYLTLGDQEWIDSEKLDHKVLLELNDKIIASNYRIAKYRFNSYGSLDFKKGLKAYILAYLDNKSFFVTDDKSGIQFDDNLFKSIYQDVIGRNGLIILLFHGTQYTLKTIVEQFPDFDLILWAHEQSNIENISTIPAIIGGGSDGEYLKQINIYYDNSKFKFDIHSIPVSLDIKEDSKVRSKINEFKLADNAVNNQE